MRASSYAKTMAAAGTTAIVDCFNGWNTVSILIQSMASISNIDLYGSVDGTNFYQFRSIAANTSTAQLNSFVVAASATANGIIVPAPAGFRYYKVVADSAPAVATCFTVICAD